MPDAMTPLKADFAPMSKDPLKASLDKSFRDKTNSLPGLNSPEIRFCPDLKIRAGLVTSESRHEISRFDFLSPCNRWDCPKCGPRKRWKLIKKIAFGKPNKFLTLTTAPKEKESPRQVFERTAPRISRLFRKYRKADENFRFARILESTKKGFPHYHFCINSKFIPQAELSEAWAKLTGAKIVDIRSLKGRAINYIAKYITKSDTVDYTRQRVSFSKNWPREEKIKNEFDLDGWQTIWNEDLPSYAATLLDSNTASDFSPTIIQIGIENQKSEILEDLEFQFGQGDPFVPKSKETQNYFHAN